MHCLGWADTEQDTQHFQISDPLSQRWVEAGATLLDKPKMERRRVSDRLDVISGGEIVIVSGNSRMLSNMQARNRLVKGVPEIGVLRAAAVARPPTGVHGELHEVGEPFFVLLCACRLTALQRAKPIQIDGLCASRFQELVEEREVADLILGIVVDILGHVHIQIFKGIGVDVTPTPPRDYFAVDYFVVLDSSQFVVLLPQIGFYDFVCCQESEHCYVSL